MKVPFVFTDYRLAVAGEQQIANNQILKRGVSR